MEINEKHQQELLDVVENFLVMQDIQEFITVTTLSFADFTGGKYFDGLDPEQRPNYVHDYNMLIEFLTRLNTIQKQVWAEKEIRISN